MVGFVKDHNIVVPHATEALHPESLQFLALWVEVQVRIYPCPHLQFIHNDFIPWL